jgi:hypothetical protein
MNCKWAEGHLSACLDGTLDPAVRDEVTAHVESCAHCGATLQEFRYFDGLVGSLPRYEPPDDLRTRIFESDEFAAILRSLEDSDAATAPARHPITSNPFGRARSITLDRAARPMHDRALTPLPLPVAPAVSGGAGDPDGPASGDAASRHDRGVPAWTRAALAAAAAVVLLLGSGVFVQRMLPGPGTGGKPTICCVAGHPQPPLSAGPRVVYEHDGALWSAPEQGGAAQRLTPSGVTVGAGWAVVPVQNAAGGDHVAYIDLKTGALHVVRSDDQRDVVVGHTTGSGVSASFWASAEGQAILTGLAWSSNASELAYLADTTGSGLTTLMVVRADGTGTMVVPADSGASSALAVWSPDGQRLAFVQSATTGQSVWDVNVVTHQMRQLSAASGTAAVRALAWLPLSQGPVVTWAVGDPVAGTYTGVFSRSVVQDGQPQQLTTASASYGAADFSAARDGGTWLLGDGTALYAVSVGAGGAAQLATVPGGVRAIAWAPNGAAAAILGPTGDLRLWIPGTGLVSAASGVAAQPGLAWAPDGSALAFVAGGQTTIIRLNGGTAGAPVAINGVGAATALAWAPDGQALAVATPAGVTLVSADGSAATAVDAKPAAGALVWSVAR